MLLSDLKLKIDIRAKVLLSIIILVFACLGSVMLVSNQYLIDQFIELENQLIKRNMNRIHSTFELEKQFVRNMANDWGHWDDCYDFIYNKNKTFGKENFVFASFIALKIDVIALWDSKYKFMIGKRFDLVTEKEEEFPIELDAYVQKQFKQSPVQPPKAVSEYIKTPHGLLVYSLVGVTNTASDKPLGGALLMARMIDKDFIDKVKSVSQLDVEVIPLEAQKDNPLIGRAIKELSENQKNILIIPLDENNIVSYSFLKNGAKEPIALIKSDRVRDIYQLGKNTTYTIMSGLALVGLLMLILLYFLSNRLIISRLLRLKNELEEITQSKVFRSEVTTGEDDEIGYVSRQINNMFKVIDEAQHGLEAKVQERTETLAKVNEHLMQEIQKRTTVEKELLKSREYLTHLAHHDALTGLPNRVLLNNTLSHAIAKHKASKEKLALIFIDIDRFKSINDAKGHAVGDHVLKVIAKRLEGLVEEKEMASRIGGDEFIIALQNVTDLHAIDKLCQSALSLCATPIEFEQQTYHLTASIGISMYPDNGRTIEELQKNADIAMYQSKTTAPGNYCYFQDYMTQESTEAIDLDEQLHKAIENNEFVLYYQPKFNIKTGALAGMEALIRWMSPTRGLVSPDQFIPYAEKTGLIVQIGKWVLEEACRASGYWEKMGFHDLKIAINMSPVQFSKDDVIAGFRKIVKQYDINPQNIEIEITESAIMQNAEKSIFKLQALRDLGFSLSIDDFGTGYTSLNHIKIFPVDCLKIDRSFVMGIPDQFKDMSIIRYIVNLSHELGISVVAEGIETVEQLDYLASIECDIAQGYLFSKPLTLEAMTFELQKNAGFGIELKVS